MQLFAYDFDKTLVPYDSFRRYLLHLLWLRPVRVGLLLLLRKMHLISSVDLKRRVTKIVEQSEALTKDAKHFAERIINDVHWPQNVCKDGVTLIISASPKVYMQHIADLLQCELLSSDYIDNEYVEMFGETKRKFIHQHYPQLDYVYEDALSDSASDLPWMKEFKRYKIIEKK